MSSSSHPTSSSSPVPPKSQPLHNFLLPKQRFLNHATNNQICSTTRLGDCGGGGSSSSTQHSPSRAPKATWHRRPRATSNAALPRSPLLNLGPPPLGDSAQENPQLSGLSERETSCVAMMQSGLDLNNAKKLMSSSTVQDEVPISSSDHNIEMKLMALALSSTRDKIEETNKSKIELEIDVVQEKNLKPIRFLLKTESDEVKKEEKKSYAETKDDEVIEKSWNLRPRRPIHMPCNLKTQNKTLMLEPSLSDGANTDKKKEKEKEKEEKWPQISIELTRAEIKEDLRAMTGKLPKRKPKTRSKSKAVQKLTDVILAWAIVCSYSITWLPLLVFLNLFIFLLCSLLQNLFPGSYLGSITPDCYKVSEPREKGK